MGISFAAATQQFHLYNDRISYVMKVLRDGHLGHAHRRARVARIGLLHGVHRQGADGIGHQRDVFREGGHGDRLW